MESPRSDFFRMHWDLESVGRVTPCAPQFGNAQTARRGLTRPTLRFAVKSGIKSKKSSAATAWSPGFSRSKPRADRLKAGLQTKPGSGKARFGICACSETLNR